MSTDHTPVLVGYDREVGGREALALGCAIARSRGRDLLVVNVRRPVPGLTRPPIVDFMVGVEVTEQVRALDATLPVTTRLVESLDPAEALGEVAARTSASAVVVGSKRHPGYRRLQRPSVIDHVVEGVPCDVVVAPASFGHRPYLDEDEIARYVAARAAPHGTEWAAERRDAPVSAGATFPG